MLLDFLNSNQIIYKEKVPLSEMTTFRIGGIANIVIYPDSNKKMCETIAFFAKNRLKYFVMGNGSNLLFNDQPFHTPIIKTDLLLKMEQREDKFTFGSGVKMVNAANFTADAGYSGMEFAHGIPGSIGGGVYMNAGAYDGTMEQIIVSTKYVDECGCIHEIYGKEHDFSYRHSFFSKKNLVILETTIRLEVGSILGIKFKMAELMKKRREKQPLNLPSAGSTFKRPKGAFAGQLIDQCGLRGYRFGGAAVSEKHCGFVVNIDNATYSDVKNLIEHVQKTVREKTGYFLECEVEIVEDTF